MTEILFVLAATIIVFALFLLVLFIKDRSGGDEASGPTCVQCDCRRSQTQNELPFQTAGQDRKERHPVLMDGRRMSRENRKLRVYEEDVKTRHTAHWDWDYLPWKEVERRLQEGGILVEERVAREGRYIGGGRRRAAVVWIGLGLLILAGVLLAVI